MLTDDLVVEKSGTTYDTESIKTLLVNNNLNTIVGATVKTNGSMLVWIPRYAYKITYYDSNNKIIGYSDSRGIVTVSGETPYSYNEPETAVKVNDEYYRTHPAFEKDLNQGGWNSRITGIWVGKFDTTGDINQLTIKPNQLPVGNKTIGELYFAIRNNFKAKTTESHMIKNSEWGAMVYFTESNFGRNGIQVTRK